MSILPNLLRSLILTSIFSFLLPNILIGVVIASLVVLGYCPPLAHLSHTGLEQVWHVLAVFGSGSLFHGLLVIGLVGSIVGILFDTYTFYRYQNLRH